MAPQTAAAMLWRGKTVILDDSAKHRNMLSGDFMHFLCLAPTFFFCMSTALWWALTEDLCKTWSRLRKDHWLESELNWDKHFPAQKSNVLHNHAPCHIPHYIVGTHGPCGADFFFLMRNVIARILLNVHKVESGGWSMLLCHHVMEACPISLRSACLSHVWSAVLLCWNINTLRIKSDSARDWATHHPSISASFLCKRWLCCVMSGHKLFERRDHSKAHFLQKYVHANSARSIIHS